jgi:hypothetical protein
MLLSIPVEDLFSSLIDITLGLTDRSLSCKFRPNVHHSGPAHQSWTAIIINIESSQGENGSVLTVSASKDETARPSTSAGKSPDFGRGFPLSNPMDIDHSAMSLLLSDTSPPQDYYSSLSGSPLSLGGLGLQHDLDFDFASGCLSTDTNTYSDFDTHHSSPRESFYLLTLLIVDFQENCSHRYRACVLDTFVKLRRVNPLPVPAFIPGRRRAEHSVICIDVSPSTLSHHLHRLCHTATIRARHITRTGHRDC